MRDSDRERPDLYKKEAEIFMDVSVLIGKPLGALRPSPPITVREEVNARSHPQGEAARGSEGPERGLHRRDPVIPGLRDASS